MEQKKFAVLTEEMFKFVTKKFTVRMWIPMDSPYSESEIYPTPLGLLDITESDSSWMRSNLEKMIETKWKDLTITELGMRLLSAYGANAVEVLDKEGNGKVFYNDWP